MLDALPDLVSASPWAYAAILVVAAFDAILPIVPSDATVLSAGVLAGAGDLSIALVIAAATAGATLGDNGAYSLGRTLGGRLEASVSRSERAGRVREWAERRLHTNGAMLLFVARFVPGGRTAVTTTAGLVRFRWRRFLLLAGIAGLVWASGFALLGYGGGRTIEEHPYFLVPFVLAAAVLVYGAHRAVRLRLAIAR